MAAPLGASARGEIKLAPSEGAPHDDLGHSAAISGGAAIVGAHGDEAKGSDSSSAPLQRLQPVLVTDAQGAATVPLDFTTPPVSSGPFAVTPFSTWNLQFWYRDPLGGPAGFNFSDGLEVTFCP